MNNLIYKLSNLIEEHPYFVEKINHIFDNESNKTGRVVLTLYKGDEDVKKEFSNEDNIFSEYETTVDEINKSNIQAGQYIKIENSKITNANFTSIARKNILYNNYLRGNLIKKSIQYLGQNEILLDGKESQQQIFSYHINVGHGNCSLLVIKEPHNQLKIWMIDCSVKGGYWPAIENCLQGVRQVHRLNRLFIEKFFLTHIHVDHFSGITDLINHGYITPETNFFMNVHYSMPYQFLNNVYNYMIHRGIFNITEPLSNIRTQNMEIWHPDRRIVRRRHQVINGNEIIENNPNNASAVYVFKFGRKSIVFPGDIETEGWRRVNNCEPHFKHCNYYMVSHHGSINGHLRDCPNGLPNNGNLAGCLLPKSKKILMGKNYAYPGIYSPQVLRDFNQNLFYTENAPNYLEIDWQTDNVLPF